MITLSFARTTFLLARALPGGVKIVSMFVSLVAGWCTGKISRSEFQEAPCSLWKQSALFMLLAVGL